MKQASRAALGTPTARGSISESRSKAGGTLADAVKAKLRAKGDEAFHKMKKMFLGAIEKLGACDVGTGCAASELRRPGLNSVR